MGTLPPLTSKAAAKAMLDGLMERIRAELRARILERIEPDIRAALDAACAAFEVNIEGMFRPDAMETVVRVLIERRDREDAR